MSQVQNLLFEIGTEEIPARFLPNTLKELKTIAQKLLNEHLLSYSEIKTFATPRRLVLFVESLSNKQKDKEEKVIGPPKKVAFDDKGNPTKAALGFARNQGVDISELTIEDTDKGPYVVVNRIIKGKNSKDILPEILKNIITTLNFPKNMRWGDERIRFARPIRWILALFGKDIVEFQIEDVISSNTTRGHRFLGKKEIKIDCADLNNYLNLLKKNFVIVDQDKRKELLIKDAQKAAKDKGYNILADNDLVLLNTYLTEYPFAICGTFDQKFLELPEPVLITSMKEHQKYFAVIDQDGALAPHFVAINNLKPKDPQLVTKGHERVLRARLSDAAFFFKEDTKRPLRDYVPELSGMIYHEGLGTLLDKTKRIIEIAKYLAEILEPSIKTCVEQAAYLCKADLLTEMVGEFPTLQGTMGKYYAIFSGESNEVALAIEEHYMPVRAEGDLPKSLCGSIVSIADKIDTICSMFVVGHEPTGTQDPYGLRRASLGILRIIIENKLKIDLEILIEFTLKTIKALTDIKNITEEQKDKILLFIKKRFLNDQIIKGHDPKVVEAVLATGFNNPIKAISCINALEEIKEKEDFKDLILAFKRVVNILKNRPTGSINETLLIQDEEKQLYQIFLNKKDQIVSALKDENYKQALKLLLELKPAIDNFFDNVLVMDKKEEIKNNRLNLLTNIRELFLLVADLSVL